MLMEDLLPGGLRFDEIPKEHQDNLVELLAALNDFEKETQTSFVSNSGYRTIAHHEAIYAAKNEKRLEAGLAPLRVPMGSAHLKGLADDLKDLDKFLQYWILDHLEYCEEKGLYFEAFEFTPGWVHVQKVAPASGHRFFIP